MRMLSRWLNKISPLFPPVRERMSPRILLQFTILAHDYENYNILAKVYRLKIINLLTFKRKYVKVLFGEEFHLTANAAF
jgi:hypothetical protein